MIVKALLTVLLTLRVVHTSPLPAQAVFGSESVSQAVDWTASTLSKLGATDDGVHTLTRWEWHDCGSPDDAVQIKSLRVEPDPPKPGHNLTIYASGTANERIDQGAYADVVVKLGLIKLLTKRFDVCQELDKANSTLQCPVQQGDHDIVQTVELPVEIPRAKFVVNARAFTQSDAPMACVDLSINFLLPDPRP